ncbi:MAG: hypothetical protein JOZ75_14050 [Candidatus Dormibacteraeota bacterium]|nr:hypothetical protein [Candidatus Dormibacteraeota bacterium]
MAGWFVPAREGERLVGFHQLRPDLEQLRWSEFVADPGFASWTDPGAVMATAATMLHQGEQLGDPFLSYDSVPDRLAWVVPVLGGDAGGVIFVAGSAAWRVSGGDG